MKRLALTLLSIAIATTLISTGAISLAAAQADQAWPSRPVKLILPLGAGSGTDTIARLFADQLAKRWSKPVVVENRPGGDGIIAINAFLSANDDHTLLFTATSAFTGHPYLHAKMPYDPRALIPAARVADTLVVVAVPTALKIDTVKELVEMAAEQAERSQCGVNHRPARSCVQRLLEDGERRYREGALPRSSPSTE